MADKKVVELLVSGGEATAGPPLGPALGPLGLNILAVVNKINEIRDGLFKPFQYLSAGLINGGGARRWCGIEVKVAPQPAIGGEHMPGRKLAHCIAERQERFDLGGEGQSSPPVAQV